MKKLLSLMLVLAFCGFASAAIDVYITDTAGNSVLDLVQPSDTIELVLWYTGDSIISFDSDIDATGPGTLLLGTAAVTATGRNTEYDFIWIPGMNEGAELEMTGSADAVALGAGILNPLARISLHCDGQGAVTINPILVSLFDLTWSDVLGNATTHAMIVNQIPEPATIALLCLGGLLLRKKK